MDSIFGGFTDLVKIRTTEHLGNSDMSFGGQLEPPLRIEEDGGESGCGGKVWIAGELLCDYILEKSPDQELLSGAQHDCQFRSVLELGSGTGVVGLCISLLENQRFHKEINVCITDISQLVPLMEHNIDINHVNKYTTAEELLWGESLSEKFMVTDKLHKSTANVDLVVAADCVYLEKAFPLLEKTLLNLTNCSNPPVILMAYRKRRKADKHFFQKIGRNFDIIEVKDFAKYGEYLKQRTHLFELVRG